MIKPNEIIEKFFIKDEFYRTATITFVNGEFAEINYHLLSPRSNYSLEDWRFLHKVIDTLEEIIKDKEL